jgi:hypothetical protein
MDASTDRKVSSSERQAKYSLNRQTYIGYTIRRSESQMGFALH